MASPQDDQAAIAAFQLMKQGDAVGAERAFKKILKSRPRHIEANFNLAILYVQQAQFGRALKHLNAVVAQNDQIPQAHHLMGDCFRGQRKPKESAKAYQRAVSLNPQSFECWFNLGLMQRETKEYESAVAAFQITIELAPGFKKAFDQMGLALIDAGNYPDGLAAIMKGSGFIEFENQGTAPYRLVTS